MSSTEDSHSYAPPKPTEDIGNCHQKKRQSHKQARRSNSRGLPQHIEVALVKHIEEAGGFQSITSFKKFFKAHEDFYGDTREKVRQRLFFLRGLPEAEHYRYVAELTSSTPEKGTTTQKEGTQFRSPPIMDSSSSDSEDEVSSFAGASSSHSRRRQTRGRRSSQGRSSGLRSPPPKHIQLDSDDELIDDTMSVTTSSSARKKGKNRCRAFSFHSSIYSHHNSQFCCLVHDVSLQKSR